MHSTRSDPRADPGVTQRISRDVLEDALRRTKSGTQRIQRTDEPMPEPKPARQRMESLAGPRDSYSDAPVVTIMGIESMELLPLDPQVIAARQAVLNTPPPVASDVPPAIDRPSQISRIVSRLPRLPVSSRTLLVALLALVAFMASAGLVGFLVGRSGR